MKFLATVGNVRRGARSAVRDGRVLLLPAIDRIVCTGENHEGKTNEESTMDSHDDEASLTGFLETPALAQGGAPQVNHGRLFAAALEEMSSLFKSKKTVSAVFALAPSRLKSLLGVVGRTVEKIREIAPEDLLKRSLLLGDCPSRARFCRLDAAADFRVSSRLRVSGSGFRKGSEIL